MKRLAILGIIACVGLFLASASVIGGPAGPPEGLDVNVVSPVPLPVTGSVNVSTVYRFVDVTDTATDGAGGGYIGMNAKCQAYLGNANARMCTTEEFFLTGVGTPLDGPAAWIAASPISFSVVPDPETAGNWLYTIVIDKGQIYQVSGSTRNLFQSAPCASWESDSSSRNGWVITGTGRVGYTTCSDLLPVACCAPVN